MKGIIHPKMKSEKIHEYTHRDPREKLKLTHKGILRTSDYNIAHIECFGLLF